MESQARKLHQMRVDATDSARSLMKPNEAEFLELRDVREYKNPKGRRDFDAFVNYKKQKLEKDNPNVTLDEIHQSIINSSGKSNPYVDLFFMVK